MGNLPLLILVIAAAPLLYKTAIAAAHGNFATDAIASLAIITAIVLNQPLPGLIIVLMQTGGEALERLAHRKASRALEQLEAAAPRLAHVQRENTYVDVAVDEVVVGDRILVRPGEVVPVDGVVVEGSSHLDTAQITGEPTPVRARAGAEVYSGFWNMESPLFINATRTAQASQYARIVDLVREAQSRKAPIQRLADRYAVWFTPITVVVAAVAYVISGDTTRILAVLVVATPCPLILATPVAILGGINSAARRSIIVRSGAALEQLAETRVAVFDKTGTLTTGRPVLHHVLPEKGWSEDDLLRLITPLEIGSGHNVARAVVNEAAQRGIIVQPATKLHEQHGHGVEGEVQGRVVAVGSREFIDVRLSEPYHGNGNQHKLSSYAAVDGRLAGRLQFDDELRADAPRLLAALRQQGVKRIAIVSGDNVERVQEIGAQLGVDEAWGNLKPDEKLARVQHIMAESGPALMIGDGTNDAPALAAATVGIAVAPRGGGIATETADVTIIGEQVMRIAEAFQISKRTLRIAKQSIVIGLGLSVCAMFVAAAGYLTPVAGALFQEAVDVGVILNALRASAFSGQDFSASPTAADASVS